MGIPPKRLPGGACILETEFSSELAAECSGRELDRVEYYPPAPPEREYTGTIEPRMQVQCRQAMDGSHPAWYVLWLKGAR